MPKISSLPAWGPTLNTKHRIDKYSELPSVLNKILDCEQSLFKLGRTEESKRAEKETGERQEALSLHPYFLTDEDTK